MLIMSLFVVFPPSGSHVRCLLDVLTTTLPNSVIEAILKKVIQLDAVLLDQLFPGGLGYEGNSDLHKLRKLE